MQFELEFFSLDSTDSRDLLDRKLVDLGSVDKAEMLALGIAKNALMKGRRAELYVIRDNASKIIKEVRLPLIGLSVENRRVHVIDDAAKVARILNDEKDRPPSDNGIGYTAKAVRAKPDHSAVKKQPISARRAEKAMEAAKKSQLLRTRIGMITQDQ